MSGNYFPATANICKCRGAMLIATGVHLVLSGEAGFGLSHPLDCSAYAIESAQGAVLFDCGSGADVGVVGVALSRIGMPVKHVFLTHAHADHSGGGRIIKAATGAVFHAGEATARIVSQGDRRAMSLDVAQRAGVYPFDYQFAPFEIDHLLSDGETMEIGGLHVLPVATPGHCADHISYLIEWPSCFIPDFDGGGHPRQGEIAA